MDGLAVAGILASTNTLKGIMTARKKTITEQPAVVSADGAQVTWGGLRAEQRVVQGTLIQGDDPEAAAKQVVQLLRERDLL